MEKSDKHETKKSQTEFMFSSPLYTFLDSPEKQHPQPAVTLDIFAFNKKANLVESAYYYDDDNSSSLPPTYDSIFAQFKEEKETRANSLEHLKTVFFMFLGQRKSIACFFVCVFDFCSIGQNL